MCGIAGHVGPTARELLPAMLGLLKHRGPDDSGIHSAADVGLGMTRLAIIDLVTRQQPMSDATGRYWIVFNAKIDNFRLLRAELSIFDTIRKLPPAHTAALVDGGLTLSRYWQLPPGTAPARPHLRPAESAAAVREWLREAVRLRLESDVPLGVFLSGGIDSSAVVASMREVTSGRIATFSVGFGRAAPSYDELPYARLVATRFGT